MFLHIPRVLRVLRELRGKKGGKKGTGRKILDNGSLLGYIYLHDYTGRKIVPCNALPYRSAVVKFCFPPYPNRRWELQIFLFLVLLIYTFIRGRK